MQATKTRTEAQGVSRRDCPRCGAQLRQSYPDTEPECITCGYVEYGFEPRRRQNAQRLFSATAFRVRYVGKFPEMKEQLCTLSSRRRATHTGSMVYDVSCPWCGTLMSEGSLSGKRIDKQEHRYKCSQGHRVSLIITGRGVTGWK